MKKFSSNLINVLPKIKIFSKTTAVSVLHPIANSYVTEIELQNTTSSINFKPNRRLFLEEFLNAGPILEVCSQLKLSERKIMEAIRLKPEILDFNPANFAPNVNILIEYGFTVDEISDMIFHYPHLLQFKSQDVSNTFEAFVECQIVHKFIRELLYTYPWMFSISSDQITYRVTRISYLMLHKINRIIRLLKLNPLIMYMNWDEVEERFRYIYKTMRISEKEISMSKALSRHLSFIILRHSFLEKCGVYIRPSKKEKPGLDPHKNPSLGEIVDSDDETFAKNVAKLSPEEYQVYKELMHYEDENHENSIEILPDFH